MALQVSTDIGHTFPHLIRNKTPAQKISDVLTHWHGGVDVCPVDLMREAGATDLND